MGHFSVMTMPTHSKAERPAAEVYRIKDDPVAAFGCIRNDRQLDGLIFLAGLPRPSTELEKTERTERPRETKRVWSAPYLLHIWQ